MTGPIGPTEKKQQVGETNRGALGHAAALGFAIALGLLKGLGVSFTKVINAGNEAQKALGQLIDDMNELAKFEGRPSKDRPEFQAALKKMIESLKELLKLLDPKQDWNSKFPPEGKDLQKELGEFLKKLIEDTGDSFGDFPVDSGKYLKDFLDGKHDFNFEEFWSKGMMFWWDRAPETRDKIFTKLAEKMGTLASQAQSQFATYQTRWSLIRKTIQNWVQVSQKAVDIQHKTASFQISKI